MVYEEASKLLLVPCAFGPVFLEHIELLGKIL